MANSHSGGNGRNWAGRTAAWSGVVALAVLIPFDPFNGPDANPAPRRAPPAAAVTVMSYGIDFDTLPASDFGDNDQNF